MTAWVVPRVRHGEDLRAVRRGAGGESGEPHVDADHPLGWSWCRDDPAHLRGEGECVRAATLGDRGRPDPGTTALEVAKELAHRLVGLHLADATESHVVSINQVGGTAGQSEGLPSSLGRERGYSRAPGDVAGEGPGEVQLRVVVRRRGIRGEPRRGLCSPVVPELREVQLTSGEVTLPGDFLAGLLPLPVLLPVREDDTQQEVVTEPRCPRVARE